MNYQISYLSPQGHAKELACSFKRLFPSRTPIIDLKKENRIDADVFLIGFEFINNDIETIPDLIQQFLSKLESREILLFATSPVFINSQMHGQLERNIRRILPEKCKFHGLFLCQGEVYVTVIDQLASIATQHPDDLHIKCLLGQYRKAKGHPNREDVRKGYRYISAALHLDLE